MVVFKNIQSYLTNMPNGSAEEEKDVMSDMRYIRKSCALITEALQKGCDVMHMPNGDIIITEVRTLTYQYNWDEKKGKMVRVQSGARTRRARARQEIAAAAPSQPERTFSTPVLEEERILEEAV